MSQITNSNARFLNGIPIDTTLPLNNQVLTYDGLNKKWKAATPGGAGTTTSLQLDSLTLWAAPTIGEVGYISANYTVAKANASLISTAGAIGAYQGVANTLTIEGKVDLFFVGGLVITPGDKVYLSDTVSGQVTNIPPSTSGHVLFELGRILASTGFYNPLTGGLLPCIWHPNKMITV